MTQIQRVPVTKALPVEALAPELRACLTDLLPTVRDERTRHQFVRELMKFQVVVSRRQSNPTQTDRTRYGGELSQRHIGNFFNRVGVFNPEKFPVHILDKMRQDPQLSLGIGVIKGLLRGLDWTIECADPTQKRFLEFAVRRIYPQLMASMTRALEFGFSSNELIWEGKEVIIADIAGKNQQRTVYFKRYSMIIKTIKDHAPDTIRVVIHPKTGKFLGISQTDLQGNDVYLRQGLKLLFFAFDPEFGNWFGRSRMINAYIAWYWSQIFTHFMARYMERRGTPPLVVQHPIGRRKIGDEELDAGTVALRLGLAMLENSVAALPAEYDANGKPLWDMKYLNDDKRAEMFANILNYFDVLKLRGLCIPDRAMAQDLTPGGTSAGSEASRDLLLITLTSLMQDLQQSIQENIIEALHNTNFLEGERVSARFVFQQPDFDRRKFLKEIAVEQIRQTPSFISLGRLPDKVPDLGELAKVMNFPVADIDLVYREAMEQAKEERPKVGVDEDSKSTEVNPPGTEEDEDDVEEVTKEEDTKK